jgi:hypothetical protein
MSDWTAPAAAKLDDLEKISQTVLELDTKFNECKFKNNQFNMITATSGLTLQTCQNSFDIMKKELNAAKDHTFES